VPNQFQGKTAIISGAAGGIGLALAKEFGALGMNIVLADINEAQLEIASSDLAAENINNMVCQLDVTVYEQWEKVIAEAESHFGAVHMVVNNAGIGGIPEAVGDISLDAWRKTVDVNIFGVLYGAQAAIPAIKRAGGGWMLNVASMAAMAGAPLMSSYSATKAAVLSMSEAWAGELEPSNIHVSVLCPLFVQTNFHLSSKNLKDTYRVEKSVEDSSQIEQGIQSLGDMLKAGLDVSLLAKRTVQALKAKQFYIITHPFLRSTVAKYAQTLDEAFVDAENSEFLKHLTGLEAEGLLDDLV
jgi:NAD(P)-dependent dehydrogenase (short-subunit alcohol dehydrogenase family)